MISSELIMTNTVDSDGVFNCSFTNNGDMPIRNFMLCFNMLAPIMSVSNCCIESTMGGYAELKPLKDQLLDMNDTWSFQLSYVDALHKPLNLSWGPQGVFIKLANASIVDVHTEDLRFQQFSTPPAPVEELNQNKTLLQSLRLVPHPKYWKPSNSVCTIKHPLCTQWKDNEVVNKAYQNAYKLSQRLNFDLLRKHPIRDSMAFSTKLFIKKRKKTTPSSYQLIITSDAIELEAGDESGVFYGLVTLLQLDQMYHKLIPCGVINDEPRFEWRGQHLDCARHFYSVGSLHRLLDLMALFKLNKFHWHGSDDEAFRFKFDCNPELAETTSLRGDGQLIPPLFGSGAKPTGGCYDANDIRSVVSFAQNNYIDVMPEIELPGHCLSLLRFNSKLRDPNDKSNEISVQGYSNNTLNPASPETWALIQPLIKEACKLFPGEYIHLGGDEVPEDSWLASPLIDKLKLQHKLENNNDILAWFINELSQNVLFNNKKTAAWQEAELGTHSESKTDKLLFAWQDLASGHELARKGAKVVLCPAEHLYFDMAQSSSSLDRGANWAGIVTLNDTVDWQIVPEDEPEIEDNILGIQGQLWSETITADKQMEAMLCPRIIGLSESAWTSASNKRKGSELNILAYNSFRDLFEQIGWEYYRSENFQNISDEDSINKEGLASEAVYSKV